MPGNRTDDGRDQRWLPSWDHRPCEHEESQGT